MSRLLLRLLSFLTLFTLIASLNVHAQDSIVNGVFFYSPTCPHCRDVLQNHMPGIQAEFGDQLRIYFVNAAQEDGARIMQITRQALEIESSSVPMLVLGSEVLIGAVEIPERAPTLIREGLAAGGIPMPDIPGISPLYDKAIQNGHVTAENPEVASDSVWDRLADDPAANALAVGILALLVFSLGVLVVIGWQSLTENRVDLLNTVRQNWTRGVLLLLSAVGVGMSASLLAGWDKQPLILLLAGAELAAFGVLFVVILRTPRTISLPDWFLPLIAAAGVGVAAYLAYVELSSSDAACGIVGNCTAVQQSKYAKLMGVPNGILGMVGYFTVLALFWWGRKNRIWLERLLAPIAVVGVAFSAYLTFLEPFVIGASCLWCLTSAVLMLMILWLMLSWDDLTPNLLLLPKKRHHRRA